MNWILRQYELDIIIIFMKYVLRTDCTRKMFEFVLTLIKRETLNSVLESAFVESAMASAEIFTRHWIASALHLRASKLKQRHALVF
jgi:hypothetical protein